MKKIIWITAVLLMLSLSVVGCGSDAEDETTAPTTSAVDSSNQTQDTQSAQGNENGDSVPENTTADGEIQKPDQETTGQNQQTDQSAQGTDKPQQGQSGNSAENEITGELTQDETKVTVPAIVLPDDIFPDEETGNTVEDPTQSTVEVPTKPNVPEVTTAPDVPTTETTTEATVEEPTWSGGLGEGIELPLDVWE